MTPPPATPPPADGPSDPAPLGGRLELSYPCTWSYTVISEQEISLRDAVATIVGELEHTLERSRTSSAGRYVSFRLEVVVQTDEERLGIFRELHGHPDVRYVL